MNNIPFFYYDIFARILPGGLTLAVLAFANSEFLKNQASLKWLFGDGAWKAAVVPFVLAGCSYGIGVLFEAVLADWWVWKRVGEISFADALREYKWRHKERKDDLDREKVWSDLVQGCDPATAQSFAHALRFWAEAKMCLHCVVPVVAAAFLLSTPHSKVWWTWTIAALVVAGFLTWGTYSRHRRSWRMLTLHFGIPVVAVALVFWMHIEVRWTIAALAVAVWLAGGVYSRDRRRWTQVLTWIDRDKQAV